MALRAATTETAQNLSHCNNPDLKCVLHLNSWNCRIAGTEVRISQISRVGR
ncbi:hypothetical protein FMEAI12_3390009 [Parafrankia sp. Ea1.12]|nr:hypothetical protein FMEAI12_3390009 [Parafrankia sp. Ea1.12]